MGVLSNRISRDDLKPGDHIYTWRAAYVYAHHGIYVGDGKVIHFTREAGREAGTGTILDDLIFSSSPIDPDAPCEKCEDEVRRDGVIQSCIDCFLSGGNLYLFEYSVSTSFFLAKARGGTCTLAHANPQADVLHRANYLLRNGFGTYNLFKNNCEDFAIYCKTGLLVMTKFSVGRSGQMGSIFAAMSTVMSSPLRYVTSSFGGLTVAGGLYYCLNRYVYDIGIRRDAKRISVERLVLDSSMVQAEPVVQMAAVADEDDVSQERHPSGGSSLVPPAA